jgi:hypothetical protein
MKNKQRIINLKIKNNIYFYSRLLESKFFSLFLILEIKN